MTDETLPIAESIAKAGDGNFHRRCRRDAEHGRKARKSPYSTSNCCSGAARRKASRARQASSVATRQHRVCTSLVYRWRRTLLREGVTVEAPLLPAPAFVPVEVASAPASTQPEPLGPGVVEVAAPSGQRIRLAPRIDARVLKAVLAGFG